MDFGSSSSRFSQILTSPSLPQVTMQLFKDKDLLTFKYRKDSHSGFQSQNENVTEAFGFLTETQYIVRDSLNAMFNKHRKKMQDHNRVPESLITG